MKFPRGRFPLMFNHSDENRSLAADATWLVCAKTLAFAFTFVLPLIMVRQLSQENFGLYRQLFLPVNTAIMILPFGFAMSAFYFLPRVGNRGGAVAMNILVIHVIIGGVTAGILTVRPSLLAWLFNDPALVRYAPFVAGALFLGVASSSVDLLALANGDIKGAVMFVVATNLAKTVLLSAAAIGFASVRAIMVASMLHGFLQLILLLGYKKRVFGSFVTRPDFDLLRQQLAYALPLGLAAWLYWLQTESHHYFVAHAFGAVTYAIYTIGCSSLPITSMFGESMGSVAIHRVSQLHNQGRRDDIVVVVSQAMCNLAAFYLPLYALLMVVGRDLIAVVYTTKFLPSWPIFAISLTLLPLSILGVVSDVVIRSYTECRSFLVGVRLLLAGVLLTSLWLLTPRYGPIAAISIMVAVTGVERVLISGRIARALRFQWREAILLKGLIGIGAVALTAGAATLITRLALGSAGHAIVLIICLVVFTVVYSGGSFVRALAVGEPAIGEWPFVILPEPVRRRVAGLVVRTRRAREADEAGEEAA